MAEERYFFVVFGRGILDRINGIMCCNYFKGRFHPDGIYIAPGRMGFASPGVNILLATLGKLSPFLLIFNDILYAFIICLNWVAQLYVFC